MAADELPILYHATSGPRVAAFVERYCRHAKGKWGGTPIGLEAWQRWAFDLVFEVDPETGLRKWRDVLWMIPRKNAKSTIASGVGHYLLNADGEHGPEGYSAAWGRDQAAIVLEVAKQMRLMSPRLKAMERTTQFAITSPHNGGAWKVVSRLADLQQGTNPHFAIIDEYHIHQRSDLRDAFKRGTQARQQPLLLTITTEAASSDSPLGEMQAAFMQADVIQPTPYLTIARHEQSRSLMIRWGLQPDSDADIENPEVVRGCNPAGWIDPQRLIDEYLHAPGSREADFRRYHLNQLVSSAGEGVKPAEWDALKVGEAPPDGADAYIGVDLGFRDDHLAVVCAVRDFEGRVHLLSEVFAPPEDRGSELNIRATAEPAVEEFMRRFKVRTIRIDPYAASVMRQDWIQRGWPIEEYPQSNNRLCPASAAFHQAIQDGTVAHDGDKTLRWHVLNMRMEDVGGGRAWRFGKHPDPSQKSDAGMAAVWAVDAALTDTGPDAPYSTRGLLVL